MGALGRLTQDRLVPMGEDTVQVAHDASTGPPSPPKWGDFKVYRNAELQKAPSNAGGNLNLCGRS